MLLYAATIFVSAFLLFLVQPVMAKQILPWFGGSATVWTTCLVFFQTALLAGYAYSDVTVRRLTPRAGVRLHALLLLASLALLPIIPGAQWRPGGDENPSWLILGMLTATIGLPYFLLSTTSPLVQAWFARARPGASPYRLFALSNFASMLALVGYPLLLEPWAPTREQAIGWSFGYALFVLLCAAAGWRSLRQHTTPTVRALVDDAPGGAGTDRGEAPPTLARQLLWCTLSATGSLLLLAVSNHITQNIAAVPLLWIVPLALYLLTFILCFDGSGWYRREIFLSMLAAALGVMAWTLADPKLTHELEIQVGVFSGGLFIACMFCHGELTRLKPAPRYLTRFYLMISVGGAAGSVLVGIVAPLVLPAYFELAAGLILCSLLLLWQVRREAPVYGVLGLVGTAVAVGCAIWGVTAFYANAIVASRNFYGVLRVQELGDNDANRRRSLVHGTILHGTQYLGPEVRQRATTYYTATSGIGRLLESMHPRMDPIRVGVIGLGTGTLAIYGSKGDVYRFYDINPDVIEVAQRDFTFLSDSDATIELALGDARLSLEREPAQSLDVLAIDAFSSDAIPVHLITSEAVGIYRRHLKPGGVIAFHVTNRFLNLIPVVEALAQAHGLQVMHLPDGGLDAMATRSDWVLLTTDVRLLARPELAGHAQEIVARRDWRLWTDAFNNLVQVLK
ncbi:MAG: fused MFS/spermidine synthase [Betaproteobacteria bacterium]|nr:fused MFS/spermidine synthase [Betaproteobacteria bacterium]